MNMIATCICVFSPVPLVISSFFENEAVVLAMLAFLMITVGVGVAFFIVAGVQYSAMQKLLCEGEYKRKKNAKVLVEIVSNAYWGLTVVAYLFVSFTTQAWHLTWLIFVAAGVIYPIIEYLMKNDSSRKNEKNT